MSRRYALLEHGVLAIVDCRTELGFDGAERSKRLFAVDAWRVAEGIGHEFGRATTDWQQDPHDPACEGLCPTPPVLLAEFDVDSRSLGVVEVAGAAEDIALYVGIQYEALRWCSLDPNEYRVALLASASCTGCWSAASEAMANITHAQLEAITPGDVTALLSHRQGPLRLAVIQTVSKLVKLEFWAREKSDGKDARFAKYD